MRIALDLEEVLADTMLKSCSKTDALSKDDFKSWDLDNNVWSIYSGVSDALWRHDPLSIPPLEDNIGELVEDIYNEVDRLDIVTARMHVDESVKTWLQEHDVPYDSIVSTRTPKPELNYDIFIDDNPEMFGECQLILRHHEHNSNLDAESVDHCNRIHSLSEVSDLL